jgi:hypothetical protein
MTMPAMEPMARMPRPAPTAHANASGGGAFGLVPHLEHRCFAGDGDAVRLDADLGVDVDLVHVDEPAEESVDIHLLEGLGVEPVAEHDDKLHRRRGEGLGLGRAGLAREAEPLDVPGGGIGRIGVAEGDDVSRGDRVLTELVLDDDLALAGLAAAGEERAEGEHEQNGESGQHVESP